MMSRCAQSRAAFFNMKHGSACKGIWSVLLSLATAAAQTYMLYMGHAVHTTVRDLATLIHDPVVTGKALITVELHYCTFLQSSRLSILCFSEVTNLLSTT